jgi:hypothetical protein
MILITCFIALLITIISLATQLGITLASEKLKLEGELVHDPLMIEGTPYFVLSDNSTIELEGKGKICPLGDCKVNFEPSKIHFEFQDELDKLKLLGEFQLVDDKSNPQFTPLKKDLVERTDIALICGINDIIEDSNKNITKYICNSDMLSLTRPFNGSSVYYFNVNMTYEVPSLLLNLEATEGEPTVNMATSETTEGEPTVNMATSN